MKISEIVDEIQRSIPRSEAEISDDEQVEQADHDVEADLVKENRVQYQARHNQGDKKGKKNNTKNSAASPLSRGLAAQGSVGKTSKLTAAADNLGILQIYHNSQKVSRGLLYSFLLLCLHFGEK